MCSTLTSKELIHKLFLLLPLNVPILLLPSKSVTKYNGLCDYFKRGKFLAKGISQDDMLSLLKNAGV